MKRLIKAGATNQSLDLFVLDSSATDGSGLTGVTATTTSLACYYRVQPTGKATVLALVANSATGAHTDGGFAVIDGTNMPGWYRLDLHDTVVANTGMASLVVRGAASMAPVPIELQMVSFDPDDGVRLGLTSLPNAAADAAGGLPISDAGGLDIDTKLANTNEVTVARMGALTDWINGGRLDLLLDAIPTTAMRGTDNAALASVCTEARLAELDAANLPADVDAILLDTAEIGAAGAGLTAIPWNASWDAEVQSECTDAINALFTFTVAGLCDSNAKNMNDVAITGAGTAADPWT